MPPVGEGVADYPVTNYFQVERSVRDQVVDLGQYRIVGIGQNHLALGPFGTGPLQTGDEPCAHPGPFGPQHQSCGETRAVGDPSRRNHGNVPCDLHHRADERQRSQIAGVPAGLVPLSDDYIGAGVYRLLGVGQGLHLGEDLDPAALSLVDQISWVDEGMADGRDFRVQSGLDGLFQSGRRRDEPHSKGR